MIDNFREMNDNLPQLIDNCWEMNDITLEMIDILKTPNEKTALSQMTKGCPLFRIVIKISLNEHNRSTFIAAARRKVRQ
jgi:hypothetical protein